MFFPDVPDVLGVPAVGRIPPVVFNQISGNLGGAGRFMASAALSAALTPNLARSSVLDTVLNASSLVSGASASLGRYPSTLFNSFQAPVDGIGASLASITDSINGDPSGPLGDISGDLNVVTDQLTTTTAGFDAGAASVQDAPTLVDNNVESVTVTATRSSVTWGITKGGKSVIEGDNFVSLEYKQEWIVADYPVEKGGFESYDKVATPFDARVAVSCGGSLDRREAFLKSIKDIAGDLELYDINTPEGPLQSVNIAHVDYKRTNVQGVGLITVYIYLIEIRETGEAAFSNSAQTTPASPSATKSPAGAASKSGGTVQASAATATQNSAAFLNLGQLTAPIPKFQ